MEQERHTSIVKNWILYIALREDFCQNINPWGTRYLIKQTNRKNYSRLLKENRGINESRRDPWQTVLKSFSKPTSPPWFSACPHPATEIYARILRCKRRLETWSLLEKDDGLGKEGRGLSEKGRKLLDILHRLEDCLQGLLETGSWGTAAKALIQSN